MATCPPLTDDSSNSNQRGGDEGSANHRDLQRLPAPGLEPSTRAAALKLGISKSVIAKARVSEKPVLLRAKKALNVR